MFERFTDRARKVMALANQEAQRFNHEYIGTEHILLGLVKEGSGVGANVLKNLDVDLRKVRDSERRLKHSQLFENDPVRGIVPRIVIRPPELQDIETLASPPGTTVRGQSPDRSWR